MTNENFTTDIVIGLEIHLSLNTNTKLFCGCKNSGTEDNIEPNTFVCPICLGHPGSKPVVNKKAIEYALKLCLAAKTKIAKEVIFSRKSYFYPDLSKNYQTTQYELPIGSDGEIELPSGKVVNLERIHMEEDPAALVHSGSSVASSKFSFIDYNRSGIPLCELVTKPVLSSPKEAREFMKTLINVLNYLNIFDIKKSTIKADANVSIKESGYVRAEIKNVSGFKEIERALNSEIKRQKEAVKNGETLRIETRGWDSDLGETYFLRSKESEADYGYIIDTDLVKIELTNDYVNEVKDNLPTLPLDFAKEISTKHNLSFEDVYIIANHKVFGSAYKKAIDLVDPKLATKWFRHTIPTPFLKKYDDISEITSINEEEILELLVLFSNKKMNDHVAKEILEKLVEEKFSPSKYLKDNNLEMVSNAGEFEEFCREAITECEAAVKDYKGGSAKALNSLVGQVMKKSKGKANPAEIKELLIGMLK